MTHGIRINFGDGYVGEDRVPVPVAYLSQSDKDNDTYQHFGTIAFISAGCCSSDVKVPLLP